MVLLCLWLCLLIIFHCPLLCLLVMLVICLLVVLCHLLLLVMVFRLLFQFVFYLLLLVLVLCLLFRVVFCLCSLVMILCLLFLVVFYLFSLMLIFYLLFLVIVCSGPLSAVSNDGYLSFIPPAGSWAWLLTSTSSRIHRSSLPFLSLFHFSLPSLLTPLVCNSTPFIKKRLFDQIFII